MPRRPQDLVHALKYAEHLFRTHQLEPFVRTAHALLATTDPFETDGLRLIDAIDARLMLASIVADRDVAEHHLLWARCGIDWAVASGCVGSELVGIWRGELGRVLGLVRGMAGDVLIIGEWADGEESDYEDDEEVNQGEVWGLWEENAEPLDEDMVRFMRGVSLETPVGDDCKMSG